MIARNDSLWTKKGGQDEKVDTYGKFMSGGGSCAGAVVQGICTESLGRNVHGQYGNGGEAFREAMRVEPAQRSNAMIYYQIGRMQEHRGKLEKALESYTMGLNVAPHVLPLRMARASLHAVRQQGEGFGGL